MVELVRDDRVFFAEQSFEQAPIGVKAGRVQNRIFHTEKIRKSVFQFLMNQLRSADKAHRGKAVAPAFQPGFGGGNDIRMLCQPEIIIRAQVQHSHVVYLHVFTLRRL